jgi:hypothetical protein
LALPLTACTVWLDNMFEKQNCWHTLETAGCFAFHCAFINWIQIGLQRNMFPSNLYFSNKPQLFHCPSRIVFSNIVCDSENSLTLLIWFRYSVEFMALFVLAPWTRKNEVFFGIDAVYCGWWMPAKLHCVITEDCKM